MKKSQNKRTCEATIQQSQPFIFVHFACHPSHWLALSLSLTRIVGVCCCCCYCYYCCCCCGCWCFVRFTYLYETTNLLCLCARVYFSCMCIFYLSLTIVMCCAFFFILLLLLLFYYFHCGLIVNVFVCLFTIELMMITVVCRLHKWIESVNSIQTSYRYPIFSLFCSLLNHCL